jgi:FkbM family methyltransferase
MVPRPARNLLRSPRTTVRWLGQEVGHLLGRARVCEVRPDWVVRCHPASFGAFEMFRQCAELRTELDGFVARCRPEMVLYDIGANFGIFSLAALRYGGENARVVAVDPSATANRIHRANLRLAAADARVTLVESAVGASNDSLPMLTTGPAGEHYMVAADDGRTDVTSIRQCTLASLAEMTGLVPTHIKIDVEGFEGEVIEGGADLLRRCQPIVFLELHGGMLRQRGLAPLGVLRRLAECGYERIECGGAPIEPENAAAMDLTRLVCLPRGMGGTRA